MRHKYKDISKLCKSILNFFRQKIQDDRYFRIAAMRRCRDIYRISVFQRLSESVMVFMSLSPRPERFTTRIESVLMVAAFVMA